MPRSRTRARIRDAQSPVRDPSDPMDDDSGRTPERMNYLRRDLRRRLRQAVARRAAAEAQRNVSPQVEEER